MAPRTTTDPLEILLEMGIDLDNLSDEEDYLSALMEATNALTIKSASDPRIRILQKEILKERKERQQTQHLNQERQKYQQTHLKRKHLLLRHFPEPVKVEHLL